jgi:tetratricopeptide (TPR) repeat protein
MKILLRAAFLLIFSVSWAVSSYDEFLKAWNAKDYPKSLQYIQKAYAENPGTDYIIYWYGIVLYQSEKYADAAAMFKKLDPEYQKLAAAFYLSHCYLKMEKPAWALPYLKHGISLEDDKSSLKQYLYSGMVNALIQLNDTKGLEDMFPLYSAYMKDNSALNYTYPLYQIAKYYQSIAIGAGTNGNYTDADKYAAKSAEYAGMGIGTYEAYYDPFLYAQAYAAAKIYPKAVSLYAGFSSEQFTMKDVWYYAECLKSSGKSADALQAIKKGLKKYKNSASHDYWIRWVYFHLVRLASELKDTETYEMFEKELLAYFKKNPDKDFDWVKYTIANIYQEIGFDTFGTELSKTCFAKVKKYYEMGMGKYQNWIRMSDIGILGDAVQYWDKNYAVKKNSAYRLDMLFWFWTESDAVWKSVAGTNLSMKKSLDKSVTNDLIKSFDVFRKIYFYFSDGQILPEMDIVFVDATATAFTQTIYLSPINGKDGKPLEDFPINYIVDEQIPGYPGWMIYEYRNQYDVFCDVWPSHHLSGIASYGGQTIVPYIKQTKLRGGMKISDKSLSKPWTIIHEFFHNVEATYRAALKGGYPFIAHMFRDTFRDYWPSWYHGEGELTYYKLVFDKYVLPTGCDKMHYKMNADHTSPEQVKKYWDYYRQTAFVNIKSAYYYKKSGMDYYYKGDKDAALKEFKNAYNYFPYGYEVNEMLGLLTFQKKDYSNSYYYYKQAIEYDETNRYRLTMLAYLADKIGKTGEACADYLTAYKLYGGDPSDLYYAGRIYYIAKDYMNAEKCLLPIITKHPESEFTKYAVQLIANIYVYFDIDYPKAKEFLDKYYSLIKESDVLKDVSLNYAIALGETGDKKAALSYLKKAKQYGAAGKTLDFYLNKYSKSK